jgi:sporulation protein YlmC with PRC-barrel domain
MPKVSEMKSVPILGTDDVPLGTVADVLFDPWEPRVVGFLVDPPRVAVVIKPKQRFAPWPEDFEVVPGEPVRIRGKSLLGSRAASKLLGYDWETTVVWRGMPVTGPNGAREGYVKDVGFGRRTGSVRSVTVTVGATRDAAVGATVIDGDHVEGFDGHAVQVSMLGLESGELVGGAAQVAGAGAAFVKVKGEQIVDQANKAVEESAFVKAATKAYDPKKVGRGLGGMIRKARKGLEGFEQRHGD